MKRAHAAARGAALIALCWLAATCAAEAPTDFAFRAALTADGKDALYQFALSPDIYRGSNDPGLSDLRVFNGAGEALPYAFAPRPRPESSEASPIALTVFALPVAANAGAAGQAVRVETNASGAVTRVELAPGAMGSGQALPGSASYLIDASALKVPIQAITLEVTSASDYSGRARLSESDDLSSWHDIVADAPILGLTQGGQRRLERQRIDFGTRSPRYYRVSWEGMPADARLSAALGRPGDLQTPVQYQWQRVTAEAPDARSGVYLFDSKAHFPADLLRVGLPQANTVARVQILSRNRTDDAWRTVTHATVYRLNSKGGEIISPALPIARDGDRYWQIRLDPGSAGLGNGQVQLELGWIAQEIVFAARGSPPYVLAFGQRNATATALAIDTLIPGYAIEPSAAAGTAPAAGLTPVRATLLAPNGTPELAPESAFSERLNARTVVLWVVLCAGVALLGWMALRLLKQMHAHDAQTPP